LFTGLIEEVGVVLGVERLGSLQRTTVAAGPAFLEGVRVGDSVNVDGACQTAVRCDREGFRFESVEETLRRTTLGRLRTGDRVNLERSLRMGDRLGGHLVAGHVDGVGRVVDRSDRPGDSVFRVEAPAGLEKYIAEKGSVALDGISLTVAGVTGPVFSVAVIPHTLGATTLSLRRPGDPVNLEADLVARYVERLLSFGGEKDGRLSEARLREMGY
jgi:riboflavin synthase